MGIYNLNDKVSFESYSGYNPKQYSQVIDAVVKAIVGGNCYAFVGAGVSFRSGLPSWRMFIDEMASEFSQGTTDAHLIQDYIRRNDLISAAELIKRSDAYRDDFNQYASEQFKKIHRDREWIGSGAPVPNDIHRLITRTHFRKVITTNYDDLLHDAMAQSKIIVHEEPARAEDNRESKDLIAALLSDNPAIVKIHGTCALPSSMIITRSDYLQAYSGGYLNSWLRTSLIQKSFLFVGYSLGDFDFVNLIKEARAALPDKVQFGHHFAIIDEAETSAAHRNYLEKCYNIHPIVDNIRDDGRFVIRQIFACIHGLCALRKAKQEAYAPRPPFTFQSTIHDICRSIRLAAGADYLALYLTEDVDRIGLFGAYRWVGAENGKALPYKPGHSGPDPSPPGEALKRRFLSMRDCNYYYAGDARQDQLALQRGFRAHRRVAASCATLPPERYAADDSRSPRSRAGSPRRPAAGGAARRTGRSAPGTPAPASPAGFSPRSRSVRAATNPSTISDSVRWRISPV